MGDWPLFGDGPQYSIATGAWTAVAASNNTKGAWVELSASTPVAAQGILVQMGGVGGAATNVLFDLGVGPAGSEIVILGNFLQNYNVNACAYRAHALFLPIGIPAGTRLAIRSQGALKAGVAWVSINLVAGGLLFPMPLSQIDTYGANTGTSGGTSIDPGATINTYGAWVQLSASCNDLKMLFMAIGSQNNTGTSAALWRVDVGIGAAGYEYAVISQLELGSGITGAVCPPSMGPFPVHIPAGTRIAVRAQCSINDATDRLFDIVLYGMR